MTTAARKDALMTLKLALFEATAGKLKGLLTLVVSVQIEPVEAC